MKIFTESEVTGNEEFNISCGDLVRLNDGREVVKAKHSPADQDHSCRRNSGESCAFVNNNNSLCALVRCSNAIYLEKLVYLQLKLVGDVE